MLILSYPCHLVIYEVFIRLTFWSLMSTDFSAWIHFWHKQFLPVNVTLSPVGNGFLHLETMCVNVWLKYHFRYYERKYELSCSHNLKSNSLAPRAREAFLMESVAKSWDHFTLHKLVAFCTSKNIQGLNFWLRQGNQEVAEYVCPFVCVAQVWQSNSEFVGQLTVSQQTENSKSVVSHSCRFSYHTVGAWNTSSC